MEAVSVCCGFPKANGGLEERGSRTETLRRRGGGFVLAGGLPELIQL